MLKHHDLRTIVAVGFLASIATGVVLPGCSGRLGPVQATQNGGSIDRPNLPNITVERAKECVEFDGRQLEKGRIVVESTVDVNEYGEKLGVTVGGIPATARDFGVCIRKVLQDMPIAEQSLDDAVKTLQFNRKHAGESQDALERFIEVIPGVPIVESELVLEADGYTVVLPVTVKARAKLEELIDIDEGTLKTLGQMALDTLGYDEIMNRAEEQGWIKTVPDEQAQSSVAKQFIGDVSLSPTPQPPVRPPVAPPAGVIARTATKRLVTRAAPRVVARAVPVAIGASAADGPLPIGDIIAVGIVVVALVVEHGLAPEEVLVLGGGQAHRLTAAASAAAATTSAPQPTTTAQPAPTVVKPRKYPNQTCEEDERIRLEAAKKAVCPEKPQTFPGRPCHHERKKDKALAEKYPCSLILARIAAINACIAARQKVQDVCFKGSPDTGHPQQIDDLTRGNSLCEALKAINCAPGHPMSGL